MDNEDTRDPSPSTSPGPALGSAPWEGGPGSRGKAPKLLTGGGTRLPAPWGNLATRLAS